MTASQAAVPTRRLQAIGIFAAAMLTFAVANLFNFALADSFVQSFNSKGPVQIGWVVAIDKKDSTTVEAAPAADPSQMYGVVIDPSQAAATVQNKGQQVFVANSGNFEVLVTTQNGSIAPGDYVSMSSINGIAAKASSIQTSVLGRALSAFNGKSGVISTANGVTIGKISVDITPGRNPLLKEDVQVPTALRTLGYSIAGKSVTAIRIYSALAVFIMAAIIAACLLWVGIRSGMIAIGRNPLSRHSILRSLAEVITIAILIFIAGLVAVYLLLRL